MKHHAVHVHAYILSRSTRYNVYCILHWTVLGLLGLNQSLLVLGILGEPVPSTASGREGGREGGKGGREGWMEGEKERGSRR